VTADPRALAALLPDEPRWLDVRGLLLTGRADVVVDPRGPEAGFVALPRDVKFGAVVGRPDRATLLALARVEDLPGDHPPEILVQVEDAEHLAPVMTDLWPGWWRNDATLHLLPEGVDPPPVDTERLAAVGAEVVVVHSVAALPPGLLDVAVTELTLPFGRNAPVAVAVIDGRAAAYCAPILESETLWDVSVETVEAHRRQGLAAATFSVLTRAMRERTPPKEPVWGAHGDNDASLRLAARLGFQPVARLGVLVAPDGT
jgi:GNAT superfamily N-acetyltransferase